MVDHVSPFPTIETLQEIVDRLLTWKIHEYYEAKLFDDNDQFVMLDLNYKKLKTLTKMLEVDHIFQKLQLYFLDTMQRS